MRFSANLVTRFPSVCTYARNKSEIMHKLRAYSEVFDQCYANEKLI